MWKCPSHNINGFNECVCEKVSHDVRNPQATADLHFISLSSTETYSVSLSLLRLC